MELSEAIIKFPPSAPLRNIVHHYEWAEISEQVDIDGIDLLPSFSLGLIFYFWKEKPLIAVSKLHDRVTVPKIVVVSPTSIPIIGTNFSSFHYLRVVFVPGMFSRLFDDIPMRHFWNEMLDARNTLDPKLYEVYDQMQETPFYFQRLRILDNFLLEKLRGKSLGTPIFPKLYHRIIATSDQQVRVRDLAETMGMSRQCLNRLTGRELGRTAKNVLSTLRFNHTLIHFHTHSDISLSQTAYKFGYYDQAHLTHEFQQFSGLTPRRYLNALNKTNIYDDPDKFMNTGMLVR